MDHLQEDAEFLQQMLRADEGDDSITISGIEASPCVKDGENYMALVSRIKMRGIRGPDRQEFRKNVVTKKQPASLARREMFRCGPVFRNETAVYSTVIPTFQRFFNSTVFCPFPKCLHADQNLIVLEDLGTAGFSMTNRMEGMDVHHCRLVLQGLARFHAMSLALKKIDPKMFQKARESIEEVIYIDEAARLFSVSMENSLKMATESLRILSNNDGTFDVAIKTIDSFNGKMFNIMSELVKPLEPLSVICHGDCWNNNILFRYRESRKVEDMRLLDLQVARYASPTIDILHFLYTSTHAELRRQHLDDLLETYHRTLCDTVQKLLASTPYATDKDIISLKQLKDEVTKHAIYGFLNALWLLPAVQADPTKVPDMEALTEDDFYSQENLDRWISDQTPQYRESIKDLVHEYVDNGLI